jgi:hypothetical protein
MKLTISLALTIGMLAWSCTSRSKKGGDEQIQILPSSETSTTLTDSVNSVTGDMTMKDIATFPNKVILTGLKDHRLISLYKSNTSSPTNESATSSRYAYYYDDYYDEYEHFMPGIDILFGYNLLNIAHYDFSKEKTNLLFDKPVLVKTLYYPSFKQDSLNKKPINRNYYLVSVYDEDTNSDSLINKRDLRRFYAFDASANVKTQIIPADYSVIRSQYDPANDAMYIYARHDDNKNGNEDKKEPVSVFWISLVNPEKAKLLY